MCIDISYTQSHYTSLFYPQKKGSNTLFPHNYTQSSFKKWLKKWLHIYFKKQYTVSTPLIVENNEFKKRK